jgi:hypothetical protein
VLAGGLKKSIEAGVRSSNPDATVNVLTIGGTAVDSSDRRLEDADVEVEFEVLLPTVIEEGEAAPDAEEAGNMASSAFSALESAVLDDDFATALAENMDEAADELVESGDVSSEDAAAAVASVEVEVKATIVQEAPEIGEIESVVVPDPTSSPTPAPVVCPEFWSEEEGCGVCGEVARSCLTYTCNEWLGYYSEYSLDTITSNPGTWSVRASVPVPAPTKPPT